MSDEIKQMVNQVFSGDLQAAQKGFESIIADKINDRIETEKVNTANRLYNGVEEESESDADV